MCDNSKRLKIPGLRVEAQRQVYEAQAAARARPCRCEGGATQPSAVAGGWNGRTGGRKRNSASARSCAEAARETRSKRSMSERAFDERPANA